ncbi:hypothetical protein PAHAL_8G247500 [Panicum hallii]|uniref:Uncharacterized protein n=1 Tax=Panicum hallii TaxID=206008 RepID=A0A2T8IA55_9POAL|nr:hypothetical protein PAHAL_8G247500 [Panicum hallii]
MPPPSGSRARPTRVPRGSAVAAAGPCALFSTATARARPPRLSCRTAGSAAPRRLSLNSTRAEAPILLARYARLIPNAVVSARLILCPGVSLVGAH